jgi:hypothetical protein
MKDSERPHTCRTQRASAIARFLDGIIFACGGNHDVELIGPPAFGGLGRKRQSQRRKEQERGSRKGMARVVYHRHLPEPYVET